LLFHVLTNKEIKFHEAPEAGVKLFLCTVRRLLVTANVVLSSLILVILMKEALISYETSVLTRDTQRHIPVEAILHSHCSGNLKSYIVLTGLAL
jgi:hypothetical protein